MTAVSAIIVTRGDVELQPILETFPWEWEVVIWSNGRGLCSKWHRHLRDERMTSVGVPDLSVYGRYAAIEHASHDLIYVQDDDVIVSDPQAIVTRWWEARAVAADGCLWVPHMDEIARGEHVVANMPQEFHHQGYAGSCPISVAFGACFQRAAPGRALGRFLDHYNEDLLKLWGTLFWRHCDIAFTTMTPPVLVDLPTTEREFPSAYRTWEPGLGEERARMHELARRVPDA